MKKLIFGLIATVFFGLGANAQDVANKNNPYDYVGIQHNEVVREFLKKYGLQNLSLEKTIELTTNICKSKGIEGSPLTVEQFNFGTTDIKNNFKGTVKNSSLSVEGKIQLQNLFDFMLINGFKGEITFKECTDYMMTFENAILNNKSLSKSDVILLLKSASVGIHSINLWNAYYGDNNSSNTQNASSKGGPRWVKWLVVAAADVAGGVAGGGAFSVVTAVSASTATHELVDKVK